MTLEDLKEMYSIYMSAKKSSDEVELQVTNSAKEDPTYDNEEKSH